VEKADDMKIRHAYIMELKEFHELMMKVNPMQIDMYKACFGTDG
jgi:hypothetical protein